MHPTEMKDYNGIRSQKKDLRAIMLKPDVIAKIKRCILQ
jgi:hypothetical protein